MKYAESTILTKVDVPPEGKMLLTNHGKCFFTVDVEDWFHILALPRAPSVEDWGALPSHVSRNFLRLLEIFSEKGVRVTCFFLGWIAERFPELVKAARGQGHEIASHGYS